MLKSVISLTVFAVILMMASSTFAVPLDADIEDPATTITDGEAAGSNGTTVIKRPRRLWITGSTGQDYWDDNCDFPGYDFAFYTTAKSDCARTCLNIYSPQICTHFSWTQNSCAIKYIPGGMWETGKSGVSCGFIRGRSNQPYP
jgi:hypothetical protein